MSTPTGDEYVEESVCWRSDDTQIGDRVSPVSASDMEDGAAGILGVNDVLDQTAALSGDWNG